jgi:hypothetical protein
MTKVRFLAMRIRVLGAEITLGMQLDTAIRVIGQVWIRFGSAFDASVFTRDRIYVHV